MHPIIRIILLYSLKDSCEVALTLLSSYEDFNQVMLHGYLNKFFFVVDTQFFDLDLFNSVESIFLVEHRINKV